MSKPGQTYSIYVLVVLLSLLFYVRCDFDHKSTMVPLESIATAYNGLDYAGSQTCLSCHEDIYNSHIKTPHYQKWQLTPFKLSEELIFKRIGQNGLKRKHYLVVKKEQRHKK